MGHTRTPKYRLEMTTTYPGYFTPQAWEVRARYGVPGNGTPTTDNIDKWVTAFEDSLRPGKPNAHLGIFSVVTAKIINQFTGEVVATWTRKTARPNEPKFQVI